MAEAPLLTYRRQARNRATTLAVAGVWAAMGFAWVFWDASSLVLALPALFTLPALWDLWRNTKSSLTLTRQALSWRTGTREVEVPLRDIDRMRMDTRLDLSVRITVRLKNGARLRIPPQCTPPHRKFEDALTDTGITTERHHFSLMQ